jgi:hypothetical protein
MTEYNPNSSAVKTLRNYYHIGKLPSSLVCNVPECKRTAETLRELILRLSNKLSTQRREFSIKKI